MNEHHHPCEKGPAPWHQHIARKEARRLRALRRGADSPWFGLSHFGVVGWSVAVPLLLGIALGLWIDRTWPSRFSWTLMLLVGGLVLGCLNAWYWINRQQRLIECRKEHDRDA